MIRLFAIDMDGTCLNDHKIITDKTLEALKRAAASGIMIVPASGRSLSCLPHQLTENPFYRYVISSNGAVVTDLQTGKNLFEAKIPYTDVLELLGQCEKYPISVSAHIDNEFVLQGHLLRLLGKLSFGKDAKKTKEVHNLRSFLMQEKSDLEELQFFFFSERVREETVKLLGPYTNFNQAFSDRYVEIYAKGASKGEALQALAAHLGLKREEIACVGDAENDLPMFAAAGLRFAMGNAIPELKDASDMILPDHNEDGVAAAISRYLTV